MKLDNYKTIDLNKEELIKISGGHKGFWYGVGEGFMDTTLAILGFFAGLGDGIREGLEE
ncbi:hypothetical protein [Lutibacter sp.]